VRKLLGLITAVTALKQDNVRTNTESVQCLSYKVAYITSPMPHILSDMSRYRTVLWARIVWPKLFYTKLNWSPQLWWFWR